MRTFECKCGSKDVFIKDSGNNKGLYCANCGKWMQWLGKDDLNDLRLAERQIEQSIVNPIPRNIDELKEHDVKVRLNMIEEVIKLYEEFRPKLATNVYEFGERLRQMQKGEGRMKVTTYRVPQLMSKMITVVCVDGIPICTVRGKKACANIVTKLQGYGTKVIDGRIDRLIEQMLKEVEQ